MEAAQDIDRVAEVERLAALDPINYEVARNDAAKRLGVRASVLDREIAKKRRALGLDNEDDDDKGQGRPVKIIDPLPWPEPVDGDMIANMLASTVKNFVVLPDAAADVIALWILHTWIVSTFTLSPRLAITSPTKGCGKTTVLRLLSKLARRAKRTGSISPASLFRVMELVQPTLLMDETEKYVEHGSDLHALINEGHCKGSDVLRVVGEDNELRAFSSFGAIAFARNGRMPEDLEQRSIVIQLQRRLPGEPLAELREGPSEPLERLTRMISRWVDDNEVVVANTDPEMGDLINRGADNWRPLFAIADALGADWPERVREAAAALISREADSFGTTLLADIRTIFDEQSLCEWGDRIFSEKLAERLAEIEGRPWAEFGKGRKPISKNQLARLLGEFKIVPDQLRIGTKSLKGYYRHQFEDAWSRYLGQGVNETKQRNNPTAADTSAAFQNETAEDDVSDGKCEKPLSPNGCDVVSFERGGPSNGKSEPVPEPPGLAWREIDRLACEAKDLAYERRDEALDETMLRRKLLGLGVQPENVPIEMERVLECVWETGEARRDKS